MSPLRIPRSLSALAKRCDLAEQVGVGEVALLALLAAPVERDALAAAGLDVAVQAVVGDVQLAADEPLVERRVGVVERLVPLLEPVQLARLALPPALPVALRLLVDRRVAEQRVLAEPCRRSNRSISSSSASSCSRSCSSVLISVAILRLSSHLLGARPSAGASAPGRGGARRVGPTVSSPRRDGSREPSRCVRRGAGRSAGRPPVRGRHDLGGRRVHRDRRGGEPEVAARVDRCPTFRRSCRSPSRTNVIVSSRKISCRSPAAPRTCRGTRP